jgi:hypothetical protein
MSSAQTTGKGDASGEGEAAVGGEVASLREGSRISPERAAVANFHVMQTLDDEFALKEWDVVRDYLRQVSQAAPTAWRKWSAAGYWVYDDGLSGLHAHEAGRWEPLYADPQNAPKQKPRWWWPT